jgi:hypothetical protein
MKSIVLTLALLTIAEEVEASCLQDVNSRVFRELESRGGQFSTEVNLEGDLQAAVTDSESLSLIEKREITKLSHSPDHELYLVAATKGAYGYVDVVVVQRRSCELARSYRLFSEK